MDYDSHDNYICRFCKGSFTQPSLLYKHVQQVHTATPSTTSSRTCPICGSVFPKYEGYRTHLRHIHGQRNEGQIFAFKCFNDFFLWKTELERRSNCKYALQSAPKVLLSQEKVHVYQCDQASSSKRKKAALTVHENCPAMICATESMKNREIKVEYWNTHSGHAVPVEEDELNAAISSLQPEEPEMHVMDMLNNIDQGIETGSEVSISADIHDEMAYSPGSRKRKRDLFYKKKQKNAETFSPKTNPIVQNFSFKKDPSKKKESSMYSLASVACGKVSVNKKPEEESDINILQKSVNKNKVSVLSILKEKKESYVSRNGLIVDTSTKLNKEEQNIVINATDSAESIFTSDVLSSTNSSEILVTKSNETSKKDTKPSPKSSTISPKIKSQSLLKSPKKVKPENRQTSDADSKKVQRKTSAKQNLTVKAVPNTPMFVLANSPVNQTNVNALSVVNSSLVSASPNLTSIASSFNSVAPVAQTYISIDNKLIPVVNNSRSVLSSNFRSGFILPSSVPGQKPLSYSPVSTTSNSKASGLLAHPLNSVGANQNVPGSISSLSTLSNPVVLIPVSNSSTINSPLVIQNTMPTQAIGGKSILSSSLPASTLNNFTFSTLVKPVPPISTSSKILTATTVGKPTPSTARKSVTSSVSSNPVKVQKVSLPSVSSSGTAPVSKFKQVTTQVNSSTAVVLNSLPGNPVSNINASKGIAPIAHNPGTLLVSPSGEFYVLEPLDDDPLKSGNFQTSTPKKKPNVSTTVCTSTTNKSVPTLTFTSNTSAATFTTTTSITSVVTSTTTSITSVATSTTTSITSVATSATTSITSVATSNSTATSSKRKRKSKYDVTSDTALPGTKKLKDDLPKTSLKLSSQLPHFNSELSITALPNPESKNISLLTETSSNSLNKNLDHSCYSKAKSNDNKNNSVKASIENNATLNKNSDSKKQTPSSILSTSQIKLPQHLTIKTVPSFSIPQSRPVSSIFNSTRSLSSDIMTPSTSSNYKSSILQPSTSISSNYKSPILQPSTSTLLDYKSSILQPSTSTLLDYKSSILQPSTSTSSNYKSTVLLPSTSLTKSTASILNEKKSMIEGHKSEVDSEQNKETLQESDVKRRVTIKSVVQEKRSTCDDDIEIMKKVKFYKLEMKYLASQEECKKLKIELAKALSKNRELVQNLVNKFKDEKIDEVSEFKIESRDPKENPTVDENQNKTVLYDNGAKINDQNIDEQNSPSEQTHYFGSDEKSRDSLESIEGVNNVKTAKSEKNLSPSKESDESNAIDQEVVDLADDSNDNHDTCSETSVPHDFMNVDDINLFLSNDKNIYFEDPKKSADEKVSDNTNRLDVYTMIQTSVLRSLHSDIEDLCKEKRQLLKDLERYKNNQFIKDET